MASCGNPWVPRIGILSDAAVRDVREDSREPRVRKALRGELKRSTVHAYRALAHVVHGGRKKLHRIALTDGGVDLFRVAFLLIISDYRFSNMPRSPFLDFFHAAHFHAVNSAPVSSSGVYGSQPFFRYRLKSKAFLCKRFQFVLIEVIFVKADCFFVACI